MKEEVIYTTKEDAFRICKKALKEYNCDIVNSDFALGEINAKKEGSFFSYGHEINVNIKTIENDKIEIAVSSNSVGIQIIDWGTNSENEEKIIDIITKSLK